MFGLSKVKFFSKSNQNSNNGFTIVEVVIVILLIFAVTFLVLPKTLDSTKQAKFISKWSDAYSQMEYIFSVINAQSDVESSKEFKQKNLEEKEQIVVEKITPFLRIKSEAQTDGYRQFYLNNFSVPKGDTYFFEKFYLTEAGQIVGIKMFDKKTKKLLPHGICGAINIDINGEEKPNTWGKDIFGLNIYEEGIEPIGKDKDMQELKNDCNSYGKGIYCSNYYLIGGKFD